MTQQIARIAGRPAMATTMLIAIAALPVHAQTATNEAANANGAPEDNTQNALNEIVVTATRRAQSSQTVPIPLTAVGSAQLEEEGVTSAGQLSQLAPSLYVLPSVSEGSPRFTIRGITGTDIFANGSAAVATYIDDVYQASQFGISPGLFDLERIEILRGPQGTTFGKNTTGGAVAYYSQTPTDAAEGYVTARVSGGTRPERFLEAAVNVPIIDEMLAMRFSVKADDYSAYVFDKTLGRNRGASDTQSGRAQVRYTPGSDTTVNLTVFATRARGDTPLGYGEFLPEVVGPGVIALSPYNLYDNFDNSGATLRIEQRLGLVNLTSITHYRRTEYDSAQDIDGLASDSSVFLGNSLTRQYGQEFRLASDPARLLSGILGTYLEKDTITGLRSYGATLNGAAFDYNDHSASSTHTDTYAVFANLTFKATDYLALIGGVRKSIERKHYGNDTDYFVSGQYNWSQASLLYDGPAPATADQALSFRQRQESTPVTWDGTVNFTPTPDLLFFARVAKGYRSGGFNPTAFIFSAAQLPAQAPPTFNAEFIKSYELGMKSTLLGGLGHLNASLYHYDYTDQQVSLFYQGQTVTSNAGKSKVDGAEVEVVMTPLKSVDLRGSAGYTDARYVSYVDPFLGIDYNGKRLLQAPRWTANLSASYTTPITVKYNVRANTSWSYRSSLFFDPTNDPNLASGAVKMGNVRLGLEPAAGTGFGITAFVSNLTNERPLASGFSFGSGYYVRYFESAGRLYGVDLSYRW